MIQLSMVNAGAGSSDDGALGCDDGHSSTILEKFDVCFNASSL